MNRFAAAVIALPALALVAAVLLLGGGCHKEVQSPAKAPVQAPQKTPDRIEPGEKDSGITKRKYVHGGVAGSDVVEIHFAYTNGESAVLLMRPSGGALAEAEVLFPDHSIKSRAIFDTDGKTLVSGVLYRLPGILALTVQRVSPTQIRIDRYWTDGSFVFSSEVTDDAGNAEITYYNMGGKTRVAVSTLRTTTNTAYGRRRCHNMLYLHPSGKPSHIIDYMQPDAHYATWYGPDGKTPTHTQQWWQCYVKSNPPMVGELMRIDEYDFDGKTVRRKIYTDEKPAYHHKVLFVEEYLRGVLFCEHRCDDKGEVRKTEIERFPTVKGQPVRYLVLPSIGSEKFFDATGKTVVKELTFKAADSQYVSIDSRLFLSPYNAELARMTDEIYDVLPELPEIPDSVYDPARRWYHKIVNDR